MIDSKNGTSLPTKWMSIWIPSAQVAYCGWVWVSVVLSLCSYLSHGDYLHLSLPFWVSSLFFSEIESQRSTGEWLSNVLVLFGGLEDIDKDENTEYIFIVAETFECRVGTIISIHPSCGRSGRRKISFRQTPVVQGKGFIFSWGKSTHSFLMFVGTIIQLRTPSQLPLLWHGRW